MKAYRLTYAELNAMTLPQTWVLMYQGKPPKPGQKTFANTAEARQYRESQRVSR
jgi:hypothetical protein